VKPSPGKQLAKRDTEPITLKLKRFTDYPSEPQRKKKIKPKPLLLLSSPQEKSEEEEEEEEVKGK